MKAELIEVIYQHNKLYGIRNKNGYLLFFPTVRKWPGQEKRYREELEEQIKLADSVCEFLTPQPLNNKLFI